MNPVRPSLYTILEMLKRGFILKAIKEYFSAVRKSPSIETFFHSRGLFLLEELSNRIKGGLTG